jgi:hypothetical protein
MWLPLKVMLYYILFINSSSPLTITWLIRCYCIHFDHRCDKYMDCLNWTDANASCVCSLILMVPLKHTKQLWWNLHKEKFSCSVYMKLDGVTWSSWTGIRHINVSYSSDSDHDGQRASMLILLQVCCKKYTNEFC